MTKRPRLIVVRKRGKNKFQLYTSIILLGLFSLILFVNNSTQLLDKLSVGYDINYIIWAGIIGSVAYLTFRVVEGDLN